MTSNSFYFFFEGSCSVLGASAFDLLGVSSGDVGGFVLRLFRKSDDESTTKKRDDEVIFFIDFEALKNISRRRP